MGFREMAREVLPKDLWEYAPSSFDVIGDICILEMKDEIKEYWHEIGKMVVERFKHINSAYQKGSERVGEFRTRRLIHLAGERKTETTHKENGCLFKVDVEKCYFSPRECTERQRVLEFINPDERAMVFFAGVGPYPICISKHTQAREVVGIELNPKAVEYFRENIKLNKAGNVLAIEGDVRERYRDFGTFDHVFMPYPAKAMEFIDEAVEIGRVIHLYFFSDSPDIGIKEMEERGLEVIDTRKVLPYSPGKWKWRVTAGK